MTLSRGRGCERSERVRGIAEVRVSYDLAVFDPEVAPRERDEFIEWYKAQTDWIQGQRHNDPAITSPRLRAWFFDMIQEFPPLNGPHKKRAPEGMPEADYSLNTWLIYMAFWSHKTAAHDAVSRLAMKHHVGFFHASYPTEVWWPDPAGKLVMAHRYSP